MAEENRSIIIRFRATSEEQEKIRERMEQLGTDNMSAFLRKMAIDGYVVKLEMPELKEMLTLLRRSSSNINQIAKRVNETGRLYREDIEEILSNQERLWQAANEILTQLSSL